ncbi:AFG1/ZapE family ATPase, partial [Pseudomonas aeruginosa]|uniref:AFG1/ZapE family ATPase n=1 Tax=Pseudomonas aeruginosa TaxID=287 RepID=UPI002FF308A3
FCLSRGLGGRLKALGAAGVDGFFTNRTSELLKFQGRPAAQDMDVLLRRHSESVLWCSYAQLCEVPLSALDFIGLCDRYRAILMDDLPCLSASQREGRIARGTEDGAQLVEAGDRELPQLSVHDDGVRRFIALVDECYDRKVPLYLEARVPLEALYTEGYLAFAFRRTLSRLREMQLARFGSDSAG